MNTPSTRRLSLVFVAGAIVAVLLIGAVTLSLLWARARADAEEGAAAIVGETVAPVLDRALAEPGTSPLDAVSLAAERLLSEHVRAVRLWSENGRLVYASDGAGDIEASPGALASARDGSMPASKAASPDGDLLVSFAALEAGAVVEVHQDYGPIAESIASSRRALLIVTGGSLAILMVLLVAVFRFSVRNLTREHNRLTHLYEASRAMGAGLELPDVLAQLAGDAARAVDAHYGVVTLLEPKTSDLIVEASYQSDGELRGQHHVRLAEWFLQRCVATGEPVLTKERRLPFRSLLWQRDDRESPFHVLNAVVPGRDQAVGVVTLVRRRRGGAYAQHEVQAVEEIAAQAAMAVEQATLFAKLHRYAEEVELSYDATLKALMAALDAKDPSTEGHSERVSRLAVAVAKEMGIPRQQLAHIERGALLHDVGKIGVPDAILHKPDALDEAEWQAMQKHPLLAGLMISKVEFLEGALPILLYHHERYDGGGYPFGLVADAIPLEARIFSVVDAYDAMTSDRPYRAAMHASLALKEIERNAGTQFDSAVVKAFTRVVVRTRRTKRSAA